MESLIPTIDKLQDVITTVNEKEIELPQIVVIGSQSAGKSSVIEGIVKRDFLPRGIGIVTRCPLVLHLHRLKEDKSSTTEIESLDAVKNKSTNEKNGTATTNNNVGTPKANVSKTTCNKTQQIFPKGTTVEITSNGLTLKKNVTAAENAINNGNISKKSGTTIESTTINGNTPKKDASAVVETTDKKNETNPSDNNELTEYATFNHKPDKKYTDFEQVRNEIENQTRILAGNEKGISKEKIILNIYSPHVVNLSLIDLPGITKVPVEGQPKDIEKQVEDLIEEFISNDNAIILAVTPANADLANSDALKFAKKFDEDGIRTVCVLTKVDNMDQGTDAKKVLDGGVLNVKLGIIGVKNRSQESIDKNMTIRECLTKEEEFFSMHYPKHANKCGIKYLSTKLHHLLINNIQKVLPELKERIDKLKAGCDDFLNDCGEEITNPTKTVIKIADDFSEKYCSMIKGNSEELKTDTLIGGARIADIFHNKYSKSLDDIDPLAKFTPAAIMNAVQNVSGPRPPNLRLGFEIIVKKPIEEIKKPSLECVDDVHKELENMLVLCLNESHKQRFPLLFDRIRNTTILLINTKIAEVKKMVEAIIDMQCAYINTKHPMYVTKLEVGQANTSHPMPSTNLNADGTNNGQVPNVMTNKRIYPSGNEQDIENIQKEIRAYFDVVRISVQDMVPKAVMHYLVNVVRDSVRTELVDTLVNACDLNELIVDTPSLIQQRENTKKRLEELKKAQEIINEINHHREN